MANIKGNELNLARTQSFSEKEILINELSHDELDAIKGGLEDINQSVQLELIVVGGAKKWLVNIL